MRTGRPRKPAALALAEGDTRKIGANKLRERAAKEPDATHGYPPCPDHLSGRARAAWDFLSAELADMQLDRRPDALMLEGLCVAYADAVESGKGADWMRFRAFASDFGISPVARARLVIEKKDEGPALEDLLNAPRIPRPAVQ